MRSTSDIGLEALAAPPSTPTVAWGVAAAAVAAVGLAAIRGLAQAFGGVLVDSKRRVLLVEPTNHYGGYVWTFPKGRPDCGEAPEATALREVCEESGWEGRIVAPLTPVQGDTSVTTFYLMEPVAETDPLKGRSGFQETAQVRWATFEEARRLIGKTETPTGRARDLRVLAEVQKIVEAKSR